MSQRFCWVIASLITAAGLASAQPGGDEETDASDETEAAAVDAAAVDDTRFALAKEERALLPRIRFQRKTPEEGLPHINVTSIVQDANGFIWLGTQDGLARFDGYRFRVYRNDDSDPESLANNFVTQLIVDKKGRLWVGTGGSGLDQMDVATGKFKHFPPGEGSVGEGTVLALASSSDGTIWLGTNGGGMSRIDPESGEITNYTEEEGLSFGTVRSIVEGPDGRIWIGTVSGLDVLDPKTNKIERLNESDSTPPGLVRGHVRALAKDDGALWIGVEGAGLYRMDPGKRRFTHFTSDLDDSGTLADDGVTALLVDRRGLLWVGTQTALHHYDPNEKRFHRLSADASDSRSLPNPPIETLFEDPAGNIWVGTLLGGLGWFNPLSLEFSYYKTTANTGFTEDKEGKLWVGTTEELCRFDDRSELRGFCYRHDWGWSPVLLVDRQGTLWIPTMARGIIRKDAGSEVFRRYGAGETEGSLRVDSASEAFEDRQGNLWFGTFGGGLYRYDPETDGFISYELPSEDMQSIYKILQDPSKDNILWIGTADGGLVRFDVASETVDQYAHAEDDASSVSDNAVTSLFFESPEVLWVGTYGKGLNRFDIADKKFERIGVEEGLPASIVLGLQGDKKGRLWVSTTLGLVAMDLETRDMTTFTVDDGLASTVQALSMHYRAKDGRFIYGGPNGFNIFVPEQVAADSFSPPAIIARIKVENKDLPSTRPPWEIETVELAYGDSVLALEFSAPYYAAPDRVRYAYRLEGLQKDWIPLESPSVNFANLESGEYNLRIRSTNRHGVVSEQAATIGLVKAPPPWRTWWAYSIYGLAFLGVLLAVYRYQQSRINRLAQAHRLAVIEREVEVTATVQSWFLPDSTIYQSGSTTVAGFYRAADKCSGDWWWYERVDESKLWLIVADVTGHGAGPAMLTAAVAMGLGVQEKGGQGDFVRRLRNINREVRIRCKGKAHMTMTAAILDEHTGECTIYGVGGLPALVMGTDGQHRMLSARGTPLGTIESLDVGERKAKLEPGERLLLLTDGIVETQVPSGRLLGFRTVVGFVRDLRTQAVPHAVENMVRAIDTARGDSPQEDDFTYCLLEWKGPPSVRG
jgi:ligand-binding sensor domain-containing protein/serine phosphatase RsbU (regulator of sigma subunit)